ncbi:MAG TPA: bifunctional diaminohydroxyphosphoribosylaminopyrimidine deaminase/5-amino-6-(5-phosphoribosylamino)uracil reductase RibD [bacterium]|nr:bifunctional diaminohydroxyphosphoribosylaminopyrimidine deaminase/5-amino-6-(5-phosphoribosylamino)uracil reductase RibD [bacterium]HPN42399.1 bifunctional diaminohydroxyphosphoribosylaminopyrimidine deaminase/5-amino-6-(5-phosphoribosylamino)uracil reductase RibD [bacterium]
MATKNNLPASETDIAYMKRALALAERGRGLVSPNPLVGCVIVKDDKVVGEGYHQQFGEAHAEINALREAGDHAMGATLYVTLEPCSHQGKTGPCTISILEAGVARVVVGMTDPNPQVNGAGLNFLRSKGISVTDNVLQDKCLEMNEGYVKYITTGKPLITLKIAQTLDGRIATSSGHSKWITSEQARSMAHKLRSLNDALLIGIGTILMDDPQLTLHSVKGVQPRRIILDSKLRVPLDANILNDKLPGRTIILATATASREKISRIEEKGGQVILFEPDSRGWVPQDKIWNKLGEIGITSVVVEGGSTVFTETIKSGFADRFCYFVAPKILGSGIDAIGDLNIRNINSAIPLADVVVKRLDTDFVITGRFEHLKTIS